MYTDYQASCFTAINKKEYILYVFFSEKWKYVQISISDNKNFICRKSNKTSNIIETLFSSIFQLCNHQLRVYIVLLGRIIAKKIVC